MRYFVFTFLISLSFFAQCIVATNYLQNFQKVLIETLPVNRVYIIEEQRVFSFQIPLELMNFQDTTVMCDLARNLGFSARPFWNTRKMTSDIDVSNSSGTKLLQSNWYWSFCGGTPLSTEYPNNFCTEKMTDDPHSFKSKQLWENISRNNNWTRSLIEVPFVNNSWAKIPHYEYRQCFRYSQSMFAALLKVKEREEKRYLQVDITTVIPTSSGTTEHYFEYWATEYNLIDILRLKRLMNSIQIHENLKNFWIYGDLLIDTEHLKIEKGFKRSPDEVVAIAKRIFGVR